MKKKNFPIIITLLFPTILGAQVNMKNWQTTLANSPAKHSNVVFFNDPAYFPSGMYIFASSQEGRLYLHNAQTGTKLTQEGLLRGAPGKPVIAKLKDGKWYVFVTDSGFLYKFEIRIHSSSSASLISIEARDFRRPSSIACAEDDFLSATPVIQLLDSSNSGYSLGRDVIMVASHHGCRSSTSNVIYALDAADITGPIVWTFNGQGDYKIDYWGEFILDYSRNAIFCGSHLKLDSYQNTIWRISTVTGGVDWANNVNAVLAKPVLGEPKAGGLIHLYVADLKAQLHALNPDTGEEDWILPLSSTPGIKITNDLVIGDGSFAKTIFATTSDGNIVAVNDSGAFENETQEVAWQRTLGAGYKIITSVAYINDTSRIYVGTDYHTIHQLNPQHGSQEGFAVIGHGSVPKANGKFSNIINYTEDGVNKVIGSSSGGSIGGSIKQFTLPFGYRKLFDNNFTGCQDPAWENPANWSLGKIPDPITNVNIQCPVIKISSIAICATSLTIPSGQQLIFTGRGGLIITNRPVSAWLY